MVTFGNFSATPWRSSGLPKRMSNGLGRPSFLRMPTDSTPQCTNTATRRPCRPVAPRPARTPARRVRRAARSGASPGTGRWCAGPASSARFAYAIASSRVGSSMKKPTKRDGVERDRLGHRIGIAGQAGDERGLGDAVRDPARRPSASASASVDSGIVPADAPPAPRGWRRGAAKKPGEKK